MFSKSSASDRVELRSDEILSSDRLWERLGEVEGSISTEGIQIQDGADDCQHPNAIRKIVKCEKMKARVTEC